MKLQTLFTTTLLLTLFLFLGSSSSFAQAANPQVKNLLSDFPSETVLKQMSPANAQVMRESIIVMENMADLTDEEFAEAQRLFEEFVKIWEKYFLTPYQACIRACTRQYIACVAECETAECRSLCYYRQLSCARACRSQARKGELPSPSKMVPGGKK